MKIAICDTCTLIKLRKGNALNCLHSLFDKILVPKAVKNECRDPEVLNAIQTAPFEIKTVKNVLPLGMGSGEREAISLAVETNVEIIFTDDEKASKKALRFCLNPQETYKILVLAKEKGLIPSVKAVLDRMIKNGEGIEDETYLEALRLAGER